jgi:hypothetical protein
MPSLYCLYVAFPSDLEETVSAVLIEHEPRLPGFTLLKAEGHSHSFATASVGERVRGRVARRVMLMVETQDIIETVIAVLRANVRSDRVVWWTTRVENFGRLG